MPAARDIVGEPESVPRLLTASNEVSRCGRAWIRPNDLCVLTAHKHPFG